MGFVNGFCYTSVPTSYLQESAPCCTNLLHIFLISGRMWHQPRCMYNMQMQDGGVRLHTTQPDSTSSFCSNRLIVSHNCHLFTDNNMPRCGRLSDSFLYLCTIQAKTCSSLPYIVRDCQSARAQWLPSSPNPFQHLFASYPILSALHIPYLHVFL